MRIRITIKILIDSWEFIYPSASINVFFSARKEEYTN